MKNREKETEMEDEPHSEEFSFPMIAQHEVDDGGMNLSCSVWLPYTTTTTSAAAATAVSECCSFPTCPHNTEVASLLISTTTKAEEDQVAEGRTPRSSAATPKTTVKLPRSPTTTSPRALFPMDSMWEDQDDGSGGVTPSRRRRSLLSGAATPRSFTAEDLAEERMDMLWEEYQEHEELVAMGFVSEFFKKHWMDDDDDTDGDDEDDDDGESSPYTASHSSSSSSATPTATAAATNNPDSTPEMMARLCCAQVMQMSKGASPATAVVPLRKPGLRVILKVLKKLFLLHHSHHHRSSRAKRSSSKVRSSSPAGKA